MAQTTSPLVITISRELGSGGSYIGHKLAERLNMYYADHEIITKTAENLSVLLEDVESHEEKITSFWENFWANTGIQEFYNEAIGSYIPTSAKIFEAEAHVMQGIVKEHSAIIIGRCGFYILRDYPNLVNIFLHGSVEARAKRLMDVRHISELEAKTQIASNDKSRAQYIKKFTKKDWTNTKNYHLSIDTGEIDYDNAIELIIKYIESRKI